MKRYEITPVPKPRMTQRDKWQQRPCVMRYRDFKDSVRDAGVQLAETVRVVFLIPMPQSWSKKKKAEMAHRPHQQKPDVDNLCKSLMDAVCSDDSHIWHINAEKRWAYKGAIELESPRQAQLHDGWTGQ